MTRVRRRVGRMVAVVVVGAVAGVVAAAPSAQAGGPETALENICEHVSHGTWTASALRCFTGDDDSVPAAVAAICENALDGRFSRFFVLVPGEPIQTIQFGWLCLLL